MALSKRELEYYIYIVMLIDEEILERQERIMNYWEKYCHYEPNILRNIIYNNK